MWYYYLIVLQVLCGCFSAFVAGRKGRDRRRWWLIGALLPVAGVVLSLRAGQAGPQEPATLGAPASGRKLQRHHRPSRCCGSYIPDCLGCCYFRRQLFSAEHREGLKGRCDYFDRQLVEEPSRKRRRVTVEEK
jgi:hypothetical protein